ncbi:MAG: hypothetical protein F4190_12870 [Acidimicrobiales bacterium]|nr:hypothetical protein [Acidimicrobiales bacterium]MYG89395.1 hypothetical protein [Acidimicrobiales bacterium]MYI28571.1 hypothetical protein [Acidimicrobiales bacterium]
MIVHKLVESRASEIKLDPIEAVRLQALGRELASKHSWWGGDVDSNDKQTVITCELVDNDVYRITVINMVGTICLGNIQVEVVPKIPMDHFIYLLRVGISPARSSRESAQTESGEDLLGLVCRWLVEECRRVVVEGLVRDYRRIKTNSSYLKGTVEWDETWRLLMSGRTQLSCQYEFATEDIWLNRLLLAGLEEAAGLRVCEREVRSAARSLTNAFHGIGRYEQLDLARRVEADHGRYGPAIALAQILLTGRGLSLTTGSLAGHTFLIYTPGIVESGVRALLTHHLQPEWSVTKSGRTVYLDTNGKNRSRIRRLAPDLVFQAARSGTVPLLVGDVKYRVGGKRMLRADFEQVGIYMLGYGCRAGIVLEFGDSGGEPRVSLPGSRILLVCWNTSIPAADIAASELVQGVRRVLSESLATE